MNSQETSVWNLNLWQNKSRNHASPSGKVKICRTQGPEQFSFPISHWTATLNWKEILNPPQAASISSSTLHYLPSGEFRNSRRFAAEILNPPKAASFSSSTLHYLPSGEFRNSRRFAAEILNPPKAAGMPRRASQRFPGLPGPPSASLGLPGAPRASPGLVPFDHFRKQSWVLL